MMKIGHEIVNHYSKHCDNHENCEPSLLVPFRLFWDYLRRLHLFLRKRSQYIFINYVLDILFLVEYDWSIRVSLSEIVLQSCKSFIFIRIIIYFFAIGLSNICHRNCSFICCV